MRRALAITIALVLLASVVLFAADRYKDIALHPDYDHNRFGITPMDLEREFRAYTVSFDGDDDDNNDGLPDHWAIPHWVAYEIKAFPGTLPAGPDRPRPWLSEQVLVNQQIQATDASYHFSNVFRAANPDSPQLGYDRGHLCMKQHAWRLGENADWNTHTTLNAVPQRGNFNQGIWLNLENRTAAWADQFEAVWIMTGPVVFNQTPSMWLGQQGEVPVAIPDALFKIVARDTSAGGVEVLAFLYPQHGIDYRVSGGREYNHVPYLTSVDVIEALTGLDFFTTLPSGVDEDELERIVATALW